MTSVDLFLYVAIVLAVSATSVAIGPPLLDGFRRWLHPVPHRLIIDLADRARRGEQVSKADVATVMGLLTVADYASLPAERQGDVQRILDAAARFESPAVPEHGRTLEGGLPPVAGGSDLPGGRDRPSVVSTPEPEAHQPTRLRPIPASSRREHPAVEPSNASAGPGMVVVRPMDRSTQIADQTIAVASGDAPRQGEIVAIGPGRPLADGARPTFALKEGDRVLFAKYAGTEFRHEDDEFLILSEKDVLGILEGEN